MRILITGTHGQLGTALQKELTNQNYEVIALGKSDLDLTKIKQIKTVIEKFCPKVVINCAAYNYVEGAGEDIEKAYCLNTFAPYWLAVTTKKVGGKLIQLSSDYVFDGSKESFRENDTPCPLNIYGMSRLAGERLVHLVAPESIIIRTSRLFGFSDDPQSHNFVKGIIKRANQEGLVSVVTDQIGNPTYAPDLAVAICQLLEKRAVVGIYHITNSGACSWYEFTKKIFEIAHITAPIIPIVTDESGTKISRPSFSVLENFRLIELGITPLRHWSEALAEYLGKLTI
ncbi:MAG: dTDP-4-dehydrorhamnose reductase [Candidatus Peregrinibacteria bacterium GW2011_GWC2_39_14]|nr:MAG: dTDP-4-dehydrorhamnose reductase [Candidatus Peregrinibacteria bacterium GW2011_GWC2_39_14]